MGSVPGRSSSAPRRRKSLAGTMRKNSKRRRQQNGRCKKSRNSKRSRRGERNKHKRNLRQPSVLRQHNLQRLAVWQRNRKNKQKQLRASSRNTALAVQGAQSEQC